MSAGGWCAVRGLLRVCLDAGRRFAQLIFIAMEHEPDVGYGEPGLGSHYQGRKGDPLPPDTNCRSNSRT